MTVTDPILPRSTVQSGEHFAGRRIFSIHTSDQALAVDRIEDFETLTRGCIAYCQCLAHNQLLQGRVIERRRALLLEIGDSYTTLRGFARLTARRVPDRC